MTRFVPEYPKSISGKRYRLALEHEMTERLARRMDSLYRDAPLQDNERSTFIAEFQKLSKTDEIFSRNAGRLNPFESCVRPTHPDMFPLNLQLVGEGENPFYRLDPNRQRIEITIGYFIRLSDYCGSLELKYCGSKHHYDDI